jgi:hypothetical protein
MDVKRFIRLIPGQSLEGVLVAVSRLAQPAMPEQCIAVFKQLVEKNESEMIILKNIVTFKFVVL